MAIHQLLASLVLVRELVLCEGIACSHYRSPAGDNYIGSWIDANNGVSEYAVFKVSPLDLDRYITNVITLRALWQLAPEIIHVKGEIATPVWCGIMDSSFLAEVLPADGTYYC